MKEKQFFTQVEQQEEAAVVWQPKKIFSQEASVEIDTDLLSPQTETAQPLSAGLTWRKKGLLCLILLFLLACVAQTVRWGIQNWQQNEWINLSFSTLIGLLLLLGLAGLIKESLYLCQLRQRQQLQQQSQQILRQSAVDFQAQMSQEMSTEEAKDFCWQLVKIMQLSKLDPALNQWKQQLDAGYSAQEILLLFSQYVLQPKDKQVQKLISQNAAEAAIVIAISPLALVDIAFLAWRNIRLVNQIAQIYQMELGYWSRWRLFKMVLANLAFAGATELVQEMSVDWLSQNMAAKFSARFAQGMGAGLLTARLGLKAMAFCRPLVFTEQEKPLLRKIQKDLLSSLKNNLLQVFNRTKSNEEKL